MDQTKTVRDALLHAYERATIERHEFLTPEHMLMAFMDNGEFMAVLRLNADEYTIQEGLEKVLKEMETVSHDAQLSIEPSVQFQEMFNHAILAASGSGAESVNVHHILYGIFQLEESSARYILEQNLIIGPADFLNAMASVGNEDDSIADDLLGVERWEMFFAEIQPEKGLVGRNKELEEAFRILCRKSNSSILVTGDHGVGKSAFARGMAALLEDGDVPHFLKGKIMKELLCSKLLGGTQYRGDLENRIDEVMNGVIRNGDLIVYVDDLRSLGGFSKTDDGAKDIISLLIPYLKKGVRFVISAANEDIKRLEANDCNALRLFRRLNLDEPTEQEAEEIAKKYADDLSDYYGIKYDKDVPAHAVGMSRRYISDRFLPEKAIDLLDEAGAYAMTKSMRKVTCKTIDQTLSDMCRTDVQASSKNVKDDLFNMEKLLRQKIYGQDNAIKTITETILMSKAGLLDTGKPIGSFLFVGPTGVGKTELSKVLAQQLHVPLHRFDMSEYSEKHSVAKLIGSPAGYVGYDDGGILTDTVRKNPYCVLLLDEIEKAHEDIYNLLLQITDYAIISDNKGRKVDFSNVVLIMTSNAGARYAHSANVGYEKKQNAGAVMAKEVKKIFAPEFINRLSSVVVFNDMDREMARLILDDKISRLRQRLDRQKVKLVIKPAAYEKLLDEGFTKEYGAREIERVLNSRLTPLLMNEILFGRHKEGFTATISLKDDNYTLTT